MLCELSATSVRRPVFHDDQHGTAIISGAGLLNDIVNMAAIAAVDAQRAQGEAPEMPIAAEHLEVAELEPVPVA